MPKQCLLILFFGFLFSGCIEEIALNPEELGLKYYPVHVGDYWIYQVSETRYTNQFANQATDFVNYWVREQVDTVFKDLTHEDTYHIIRERRYSITDDWGTDSVYVVNKSNSDVRVTQNNVRVVKFIFPVVDGKKWNAQIFNTQSGIHNKPDESFYSFASKSQPFLINGTTYSNTVKVIQLANENAIERQDLMEVYGYGVGRLYKQVISYNYCSDPDRQNGCEVGQQFIISGLKRIEKLQEHGSYK